MSYGGAFPGRIDSMKTVKLDALYQFAVDALAAVGVSKTDAMTTADVLVATDTFGVLTHGTKNLYGYIRKIRAGGLDANAVPTVERQGAAFAVINANKSLGMVVGSMAMRLAIEKAKNCGIAYVGVRGSCHFGAAGYYANLAAKEGMIGIAMSNADPVMAPPGGRSKTIGTNPFAFAAPLENGRSIFLDIALSQVAALKVIMAQEKEQSIPDSWLVDETGQPTTDASLFPKHASLQPMAAHKGYGLAVLVELLASVITGAGILSEIASWNLDLSAENNAGHAFIALDISQIMAPERYYARISQLAKELHSAPKAIGVDRIFLPGEMDWDKRETALASGTLAVTDAMADSFIALANECGLDTDLLE